MTTILCIRKTESYNNIVNKDANGIYHGLILSIYLNQQLNQSTY